MKYLEVASLDPINSALVFDTPECKVLGRIEPYSCKIAGADKKLLKHLEMRYNEDCSQSLSPDSFQDIISPFGPMNQPAARKAFFHLIATLNASYPDYDFSDVKPEDFTKQPSISMVISYINNTLFNLQHGWIVTDMNLWKVVDDIIELDECTVYSYNPDVDSDPNTEEGSIWSFNFFFYNKKLKRTLFFTVRSLSKNAPVQEDEEVDEFSDSCSDVAFAGRAVSYEEYVMGDIEI